MKKYKYSYFDKDNLLITLLLRLTTFSSRDSELIDLFFVVLFAIEALAAKK